MDAPESTARPRRRRKEARPGEIIDAGMREFADNGYAGARLDDVARRANVAKGTIYRYFENKQALFEAVLKSRAETSLAEIGDMIEDYEGSAETLLRLVISKIYRDLVLTDGSVLLRVIIGEGRRFPELRDLYYRNAVARGMAALQRIIAHGVRRGEFRPDLAADYPRVVVAPAIAAAIWRQTFDAIDPLDVDRHLAAHLDLILHGLLTRDG